MYKTYICIRHGDRGNVEEDVNISPGKPHLTTDRGVFAACI